ncbi:hypothetical protein J6590_021400 [Homalodisca vitripennis]|nr:hypothetical protein J6590_021400 [Homalodisca vitripennis]
MQVNTSPVCINKDKVVSSSHISVDKELWEVGQGDSQSSPTFPLQYVEFQTSRPFVSTVIYYQLEMTHSSLPLPISPPPCQTVRCFSPYGTVTPFLTSEIDPNTGNILWRDYRRFRESPGAVVAPPRKVRPALTPIGRRGVAITSPESLYTTRECGIVNEDIEVSRYQEQRKDSPRDSKIAAQRQPQCNDRQDSYPDHCPRIKANPIQSLAERRCTVTVSGCSEVRYGHQRASLSMMTRTDLSTRRCQWSPEKRWYLPLTALAVFTTF